MSTYLIKSNSETALAIGNNGQGFVLIRSDWKSLRMIAAGSIFFILFAPVWCKPPPLTEDEARQMKYRNKLYNAVQDGDEAEIRKQWNYCHDNNIDIAGAILGATNVSTVKLLEALGADIDRPQPVYPFKKIILTSNILQAACMDGHVEVVRYLLSRDKADVRIRDEYGRSLLSLSVAEGWTVKTARPEIVQMLITKGVALDAADDAGMTPLMGMVCVGDVENFRLLVDAGARDSLKDKDGKTVRDYIAKLEENEGSAEKAEQMSRILAEARARRSGARDDFNQNTNCKGGKGCSCTSETSVQSCLKCRKPSRTPTGFHSIAQGCPSNARATLGLHYSINTTLKGLPIDFHASLLCNPFRVVFINNLLPRVGSFVANPGLCYETPLGFYFQTIALRRFKND